MRGAGAEMGRGEGVSRDAGRPGDVARELPVNVFLFGKGAVQAGVG